MKVILNILRNELSRIVDNIDSGNSNLSAEELEEVCEMISILSNAESKLSKYQVIDKLHISRATFDNYVAKGVVCKGRSQQGFKEKYWYNKDLDKLKIHLGYEVE